MNDKENEAHGLVFFEDLPPGKYKVSIDHFEKHKVGVKTVWFKIEEGEFKGKIVAI